MLSFSSFRFSEYFAVASATNLSNFSSIKSSGGTSPSLSMNDNEPDQRGAKYLSASLCVESPQKSCLARYSLSIASRSRHLGQMEDRLFLSTSNKSPQRLQRLTEIITKLPVIDFVRFRCPLFRCQSCQRFAAFHGIYALLFC